MRFFVVEGFWVNVDLCEEKEPKAARLNQDTWSIEVSTWSMKSWRGWTWELMSCFFLQSFWFDVSCSIFSTNHHICGCPFSQGCLAGSVFGFRISGAWWPWLAIQPHCLELHAQHPPGARHPNNALRYWWNNHTAPPCWRRRWVGWWWRNGENMGYARRRIPSGGTKGEKRCEAELFVKKKWGNFIVIVLFFWVFWRKGGPWSWPVCAGKLVEGNMKLTFPWENETRAKLMLLRWALESWSTCRFDTSRFLDDIFI